MNCREGGQWLHFEYPATLYLIWESTLTGHVPDATHLSEHLHMLVPLFFTIDCAIGTIIPISKMRRLRPSEVILPRVIQQVLALEPRQCTHPLPTLFMPFMNALMSAWSSLRWPNRSTYLLFAWEGEAYEITPLDLAALKLKSLRTNRNLQTLSMTENQGSHTPGWGSSNRPHQDLDLCKLSSNPFGPCSETKPVSVWHEKLEMSRSEQGPEAPGSRH